jgi:hypothetical protein
LLGKSLPSLQFQRLALLFPLISPFVKEIEISASQSTAERNRIVSHLAAHSNSDRF